MAHAATHFARSSVIEGDQVNGVTVLGFGFVRPTDRQLPTPENDRLLLEGDQDLGDVPDRPVPPGGDAAIRYCATLPAQRLPEGRTVRLPEGLDEDFRTLLTSQNRGWCDFATGLLQALHDAGHITWLCGGAVRDMLATRDTSAPNDLDMAGTAPAGEFTHAAYRQLALADKAHLRQRVSHRLICSVRDKEPLIEYKALHQTGFRFLATGADLHVDANSRDFTVNAIYYDPIRQQLLDPLGTAVIDLTASPRQLTPVSKPTTPAAAAVIVLRAIKFAYRWNEVDHTAMSTWVGTLPPDVWDQIDDAGWQALTRDVRQIAAHVPADRAHEIAEHIGVLAKDLVSRLAWRSR